MWNMKTIIGVGLLTISVGAHAGGYSSQYHYVGPYNHEHTQTIALKVHRDRLDQKAQKPRALLFKLRALAMPQLVLTVLPAPG